MVVPSSVAAPSELSLILEAVGLAKSYGDVHAVRGVDLRVASGSVHGLLGPNGSGKSTTVRMLLGLVRPDAGTVRLFGERLERRPTALLKRVGSLVETPSFIPYLSGRDNLLLLERYGGRRPGSQVDRALHRVNLHQDALRRFKNYSLGMKQRLGIAAAMLDEPELIILDEPTNGLDPAGTREVRDLIPELARDGHTVVLCSHLLHEVEQVCDTVSIFNHGRIVQSGRTVDLLAGAGHLEVIVSDIERAITVFAASRWSGLIATVDGVLIIEGAAAEGAAINQWLGEHGLYPSVLRPMRPNLEDVFLAATEEVGSA